MKPRGSRSAGVAPAASAVGGDLFDLRQLVLPPRARQEAAIRARCHSAYLGNGIAVARVLGRFKLFVETADFGLSTHLLMDGFWEMWTTEALAQLVPPGAVCVDAAAGLGYFALLMAALTGADGRVHAFEPDPRRATLLARSLEINGFAARSHVHRRVLGDGDDAEATTPAAASARDRRGDGAARARLDSLGILPDVIRIDVDGGEAALWRGLSGILAARRPLTIVMKLGGDRGAGRNRFAAEIQRHGFALSRLSHDDGLLPWDFEQLAAPGSADATLVLRR